MDSIKIRLFGAAADRAGTREADVESKATTLDELWPLLTDMYPGLRPMRETLAFAVNEEYARGDAPVEWAGRGYSR